MTYETVKVDIDARGVATLTFNRPDKHNAMNTQFCDDMHAALADLAASSAAASLAAASVAAACAAAACSAATCAIGSGATHLRISI